MGNANSTNGIPQLAFVAVARQLRLERLQIVMMRESLQEFCDSKGFVNRERFDISLNRSKITQTVAIEVFDLLFTMWDHHAIGQIPAKKFCAGIAPLACSFDDIASALRFSLYIYDDQKSGKIFPRDLHDVLISIDNTASYFGDAHLEPGDIDSVVDAIFNGQTAAISYEVCVKRLQNNPYIKRFMSGKTRPRVQFKEYVEVATNRIDPNQPYALTSSRRPIPTVIESCPSPLAEKHINVMESEDGDESSLNRQLFSPVKPQRSSSGLESWASFITEETSGSRDPPSTILITPYSEAASSPLSLARGRDP